MILSIANQKGGVAKTTTTIALGANLKRKGYTVLAIDLDPQCNLTEGIGVNGENVVSTYEILKHQAKIADGIQTTDFFDILPANIMLAGAELELNATGKEYRLKEALDEIKDKYDFILIDTPPSLGILTTNAFTASDEILIPTTPGVFPLSGIAQLTNTITNVRRYCNNTNLKINGILITRFDKRININKDMKELVESFSEHIDAEPYQTQIRSSIKIEEGHAANKNIFEAFPDSTVAIDYDNFTKEFLKRVNKEDK